MAFLLEKAGGIATTGSEMILDITPKVNTTFPFFESFYKKNLEHSLPLSNLAWVARRC